MLEKLYAKITSQKQKIDQLLIPSNIPELGTEAAPRYKQVIINGHRLIYDDLPHLYFLVYPNQFRAPLISVTTINELFEQEFDSHLQSERCAHKDDYMCNFLDRTDWDILTLSERQQRILTAWKTNSDDASLYGTTAHAAMELLNISPGTSPEEAYKIMSDRFEYEAEIIISFGYEFLEKVYNPFRSAGYELIAEPLIFDFDIMAAGQGDLIAVHHKHRTVHVLDYKTNKTRPGEERIFGNMLEPVDDLPDINLSHYILQVCNYQRFILKNMFPGYSAGINYILWLNRETGEMEFIPVDPVEYWTHIDKVHAIMRSLRQPVYGF